MHAVQTRASLQRERMDMVKIERIECFRFDRETARLLLPECGSGDCCGILMLGTGSGELGVGVFRECALKGDFIKWACAFQGFKHHTLSEGLLEARIKHETWGDVRSLAAEAALRELAGGNGAPVGKSLSDSLHDHSFCFEHAEAYVIF
ncbi:hypothetical protein [Paenibacillus glycinis]|uniref:Uncharacterized protein n=1 Tax=Paenibacillus glycinis TaxID=2697035 RepID=A0ABW9XST7_9BACL|nr:hypothetical protein [Paenibacillus glycinis]NBD25740.1 hypothetical protein [Paenibacillus glycinis]